MCTLDNRCDATSELTLDMDEMFIKLENILKKVYPPKDISNSTRCQSCRRKALKFYCGACVTSKNIVHTKQGILLSDKYSSYVRAKGKIKLLEDNDEYFIEKTKEQRLIAQISKLTEVIAEAKKKLEKRNAVKIMLNEEQEKQNYAITIKKKKLVRFDERFKRLLNVYTNTVKLIKEKRTKMKSTDEMLRKCVSNHVNQVLEILPVTLYSPDTMQLNNTVNVKNLLTYIEEGANTSYMRGEWEFTHQPEFEAVVGKIFKQYLPADGDYIDFHLSNKDKKEMCYNIPIGLSYLVQLINLVAFYVDVILPRQLHFADFSKFEGADMNSPNFHKLIYKMNCNIFHLCLSQGVPAKYLHPHRAIPNVIALMYHPDVKLGRFNSIVDLDSSANEYLSEVEVAHFPDSDDEENGDKGETDGWEKLTPTI